MNNFDIKITKKIKLLEVNNEMVHNFYYLIHGKIINESKTKYKPFKFVLFFDVFDVCEFLENEYYNENDIKDYIDELIFSYTQNINSYENCDYFYELCNESIKNYNKLNTRSF